MFLIRRDGGRAAAYSAGAPVIVVWTRTLCARGGDCGDVRDEDVAELNLFVDLRHDVRATGNAASGFVLSIFSPGRAASSRLAAVLSATRMALRFVSAGESVCHE